MTLLETTRLIEYIGSKMPNVNTVVDTENIYDLNADNYEVKYSAFVVQQQQHMSNQEGFITYNFNLYYIDRLTIDKKNKLEIQSTAINVLQNIINIMQDRSFVTDVTGSAFTTFTEQFTAECAGAYCSIAVTTPNISLCSIYDAYEYDFNEDFGKDFWTFATNFDLSKFGLTPQKI